MRVLITQRVEVVEAYGERRDSLDQAWMATIQGLVDSEVELVPVPNRLDGAAFAAALAPSLLVLSGGNDIGSAPERDATEAAILEFAADSGVPVLGVCRGMQVLQYWLGGPLTRCEGHVARAHEVSATMHASGPARMTVNSYHSFGIQLDDLVPALEPLYLHADGSVEAVRHRTLPWLGVMWHPERPGADGARDWLAASLREVR